MQLRWLPSIRMGADRPTAQRGDDLVALQLDGAVTWLQSDDARSAAGAELARLGLRSDDVVDDLLGDVALAVLRRFHRLGPLDPRPDGTSGVVAYCRRSVRNAAIDVARGPRHLLLEDLVAGGDDPDAVGRVAPARTGEDDEVVDLLHAEHLVATTRRDLFTSIEPRGTWRWSAALALLSLARTPGVRLRRGTPEPAASASDQRTLWAALHYAGRSDCFADQRGAPDPACRMRRTRAMRQVVELLQSALGAAARSAHGAERGAEEDAE